MKNFFKAASALAMTGLFLTGCATNGYDNGGYVSQDRYYDQGVARSSYVSGYGVVDSIQVINSDGRTSGLGAVAGGVIGGVLGNQVGSGGGRTAATAIGAVGGAVIGNQMERRNESGQTMYQIGVRMERGGYQTITQDSAYNLEVGVRVRVENGRVVRY